MEQRPS